MKIDFDPDILKPVIDLAVETALARFQDVAQFRDLLGDQLMFTEPQAARLLGLTPTALKSERAKGRIHYSTRRRQIKYLREHLLEYVENWTKTNEA